LIGVIRLEYWAPQTLVSMNGQYEKWSVLKMVRMIFTFSPL